MTHTADIRVCPAVYGRGNLETLEAAIRIIDPDTGQEFFSMNARDAEPLIAAIRKAAGDAEARVAELAHTSIEERRLIASPAEGRA